MSDSDARTCDCKCHRRSIADRLSAGVSVLDELEAALACPLCARSHCYPYVERPVRPRPKSTWVDPPPAKSEDDGN